MANNSIVVKDDNKEARNHLPDEGRKPEALTS